MTKELTQAGDAVRQQESDLRLAVDTLPGLVWTALPDGYCDFLNQRSLEYTGLTLEEAKGWGWTAAVCPQDLDGLLAVWRAGWRPGGRVKRICASNGWRRRNPDRLARSP